MSDNAKLDVYTRLALLWTDAVWGWLDHMPSSGALQKILKATLSEEEAEALCEFPIGPIPLEFVSFDQIAAKSSFPRDRLQEIFDGLVERGLLYYKKMEDGSKGYSILRGTYGYSQAFFWKGEITDQTREIAKLMLQPDVMKAQMDFFTTVDTKAYRYIPTTEAIDPNWQNVYPSETIEKVINSAYKIALAHCPCRIRYELVNGKGCGHPTDVCLKINELAECVIGAGLAKEISHEEALEVIKRADKEGLVHFADNTGEGIKHICNCCGDACWNVGPIRRRQVPRDLLMATYCLRETDEGQCVGCGSCVDICPVAAVRLEADKAKVDLDWCIGCGVCVPRCSTGAIRLVEKEQKPAQAPTFSDLHIRINSEREAIRGKKQEGVI